MAPDTVSTSASDQQPSDDPTYQALTLREENDLERLMAQCEFTSHNTEAFTEQLSREVSSMDTTNIQQIMASEARVAELMEILQVSVDETLKLELRIEHYQNLLKNVRDTVFHVEQKEASAQLQQENNVKLLTELEYLINEIDFSSRNESILIEGDLTSDDGINACVNAANELNKSLHANIHPALTQMQAVIEQQRHLQRLQSRFAGRVANHIASIFRYLIEEYGDSIIRLIQGNDLVLPNHSLFYSTLLPYTPLIKWLQSSAKATYDQIGQQYVLVMKEQYGRELRQFFDFVRDKLAGGRQGSTISSGETNLSGDSRRRGGGGLDPNRHRSSSVPGTGGEYFDTISSKSSEISLSEWEEFDSWIDKMLSAIDPVCLAEQQFCVEFFNISLNSMPPSSAARRSSAASNHSLSPSPTSNVSGNSGEGDARKSELLRVMMNDLFADLLEEFIKFASHYDKVSSY